MAINVESFMPDLAGRVAIVTGGNSGLGFGASIELAKKGARVYIAGRSESKFEEAVGKIRAEYPAADVRFLPMDLADLASVQKAAEIFVKYTCLMVMCSPYEETKEGFELQIAVNYIGHFLLTKLLLPCLFEAADSSPAGTVRIINVSSDAHENIAPKGGMNFEDMNLREKHTVWARYGHSKLANILHAKELARRYPSIICVSVHPGKAKTNLSKGPVSSTLLYRFLRPFVEFGAPGPRKGAVNILFVATSASLTCLADSGGYFIPVGRKVKASKCGEDSKMAHRLWEWTQGEISKRGC
ncbi:retinol dehydrogenase [Aspergillus ellipticus CBS 707.79]|uniref:Retinol dehydrogenase n=1 Tax=Aspergillus ellipticus CBS 707.79 TaxID=1448320 RepID=A0A319CV42_9EURO|nr:retinol dehydrogenase [Aspergillus ellipticus CBS 707.79]